MKKTHLLHFVTKKQAGIQQQIVISNTVIKNISSTRFLGLIIGTTLSWKDHITEIIPKLNKACYIVRTLIFLISPEVLRMVYFSYFQSVMSYGIIFWGNSHHSVKVFKIKKTNNTNYHKFQ